MELGSYWDQLYVDNGDSTWTFTFSPPTADMEYLLIVDGVQEDLTANTHLEIGHVHR